MKKFLNSPDTVLGDALAGMAAAHPSLRVDTVNRVITRAEPARAGKVALISGGGSGHEPLHGGFVGTGMLDAACPGEVFTSPVPDQMHAAAKAADSGGGVVFVVKNYTGDVMNFRLAAELAEDDGIEVQTVLVDDDVAVQDSTWTAGRRGTGATLFVEKIAGALAERDAGLAAVGDIGRQVNAATRSFAVALTACTTPGAGKPGFELPDDEMEVGVGIHGEPGRSRQKLQPAREIVAAALDAILGDLPARPDARTIVMVNGLGGTPLIELYLLYGEVAAQLADRGVHISRNLVGNYVTSLDMAGASFTVCQADDRMLELWDAPVNTPALRWGP
ncbi:PEP-dependent dihydroxyacetone kinase, dihydroxyacetone-binding subunit DhaK [Actinomadura sp. RB99]|uniref:dihydroxyacetone kinase subunit DhaK n=1 Tax=Actinomadura sp. RB99 TaxID=2691577 RepID=UPI00168500C2|nr:dihydroxyacetone kinase subunit DhaK [Actinomadura sp. RB99]MBD2892401.1 PEP-dependent dihydroxyacetone kinase, dihydroxyacetone-binding subunit DhaK [Actinomadura sp. RB99]